MRDDDLIFATMTALACDASRWCCTAKPADSRRGLRLGPARLSPLRLPCRRAWSTRPPDAPNLASTLNIGAFNLGNAAGAFLGGLVLDQGWGLAAVPIAAFIVAAVALAAAALGMLRDRSAASRTLR